MKKQALAALAILGATMGMGATPQNMPTNQTQNQQRHNDGVEKQLTTVRKGPVTALNPSGLMGEMLPWFPSRSPKEYGQWLQATGRQKWVKSKRK